MKGPYAFSACSTCNKRVTGGHDGQCLLNSTVQGQNKQSLFNISSYPAWYDIHWERCTSVK